MIILRLTWGEIHMAGLIAMERRVMNIREKAPDRHGLVMGPELGADRDWQGVIAEVATCRFLDRYHKPLERGSVDASVAQVRSIESEGHRLIVHNHEADDLPFVLVLVKRDMLPNVGLCGWIMGRDAKRPEYLADPTGKDRPAFFVPNREPPLQPMETLLARFKRSVAA